MPPRNHVYDKGVEPVPGYRLTDYLGGGTFGEVWKTIDLSTNKFFALKIIDLSYSSSALKELRALKLVMNLNHPNLVPITKAWLKDKHGQSLDLHAVDLVRQKGKLKLLLILMGLGEKSLSARLDEVNRAVRGGEPDDDDEARTCGIPPGELVNYMHGAAKGIDYLNAARHEGVDPASDGPIVHCDIKPDNMMIVAGTEVQIADCGVAVSLNQDTRKTVSAAFSPVYAPPELSTNKPSTGTDQYSLAISYYELRTGRRPFRDGMNQIEMMTAHSLGDLDFTSATLTAGERRVLKWATSPRIADRYPSCLDMVKQLDRSIEGLSPKAPSDLQKSAPVVLIPAGPPPVVSPPAKRADRTPGVGDTGEHNVDLFTPPPAAVDWPVREMLPNAGPAIAAEADDRPEMGTDPNDPTGPRFNPVELDPEIADIIRKSGIVATPGVRRLPDPEPSFEPIALVKPPKPTTGLADTIIPNDTGPETVPPVAKPLPPSPRVVPRDEDDEPRRPARPSRKPQAYDGTIAPGYGDGAKPAANEPPARPVAVETDFKKRHAGKKSSAGPLIAAGVAVVLVIVGGVAALLAIKPDPITPTTAPITPTTVPITPTTEGKTLPTTATKPPPVDVTPPVPTTEQRFAEKLAHLKPPFQDNALLVELLDLSHEDSPLRAALVTKLIGEAGDHARRADLADFAAAHAKWWPALKEHHAALAHSWYQVHVKKSHDEALSLFETAPTRNATKDKLASLRAVLKSPTAAFVAADAREEFEPAGKLVAVGTAWENAKDALPEFANALTVSEDPPAGKFFAAEYVKLAREADVPIASLRDFRDKTNSWSAVNPAYQVALADYVQNKLRVASPNWAEIRAICKSDTANGWTALAAADAVVASGTTTAIDLPTKLDFPGEKFAQYLKYCADGNLDGLVRLYKEAKPIPLLDVDFRKKTAASILLERTELVKAHPKWESDRVQYFFTNPYDGSGQLDKIESQLNTAVKLGGKLNETQQIHAALINAAANIKVGKVAEVVAIDEKSLTDDQLAAALAYSKIVADDAKRSDKDRLAAAARAARLAFRKMEWSFADCENDAQTSDREKTITEKIAGDVLRPAAGLITKLPGRDANALKFAALRSDIFLKNKSSDEAERKAFKAGRLGKLTACAEELAGTPDEAAALAFVATYTFIDAYDPKSEDEDANVAIWKRIKRDAVNALVLDPRNSSASMVLCYVYCGEYKKGISSGRPAPKGIELTTTVEIDAAIQHFGKARANLRTRKLVKLPSMEAKFLRERIAELKEAGGDEDRQKELKAAFDAAQEAEKRQMSPTADTKAGT
jgi:serine/threonine protein kinase